MNEEIVIEVLTALIGLTIFLCAFSIFRSIGLDVILSLCGSALLGGVLVSFIESKVCIRYLKERDEKNVGVVKDE